jgi:hypothetical protein
MPRARNVTLVSIRHRFTAPTLPLLNAIDLRVTGRPDTEVPRVLRPNRTTISTWRLYAPGFRGALHTRRADRWSAGANRIQSLISKALDVLPAELHDVGALTTPEPAGTDGVVMGILRPSGR